jgi:5-methylcytosine-specific restriction endonuclease McrA
MPGDTFYSSTEWHALRLKCLANARWKCQMCGAPLHGKGNAHVDHIKSRRTHPSLAMDVTNLQALCAHHHNSIKQAIESTPDRPPINAQGFPPDWSE